MDKNGHIHIELEAESDLEYHFPNEKDKFGRSIPHRKAVTGSDRKGNARLMSVVGIMPTVVHGSDATDDEPHTLVIFEWKMVSERRGLRFKSVTIELSFAANGPRGAAEYEAAELRQRGFNINYWDPEVVAAVPTSTRWYNRTRRDLSGKHALDLGFSAGFAPFFSVEPKYSMERNVGVSVTDSVQVTGQPFVVGSGRNRPNGIRWTLLENEGQRSGVPAYMRTAVLLKRQPDDDGLFLGHVKVEAHVSWWEDLKEKMNKLTGDIPRDEPIIFDPTQSGSSAFDEMKKKLDKVDIDGQFQIVSLEPLPVGEGTGSGDNVAAESE